MAPIYGIIGRLLCIFTLSSNFLDESLVLADSVARQSELSINEHFTHLLSRSGATKRVHIVSELVRNGLQIQIEEFLDLNTWNQFIQFKWHEEKREAKGKTFFTKRVNFVAMNSQDTGVLIQYEPYNCTLTTLSPTNETPAANWSLLVADSRAMYPDDPTIRSRDKMMSIIVSMMSPNSDSPYMTSIQLDANKQIRLFGICGIWAKAEYPSQRSKSPRKLFINSGVENSATWRLDLEDSGVFVDYSFDTLLLDSDKLRGDNTLANEKVDSLTMVELRIGQSSSRIDLINVISVDYHFSDRLAVDLFKLPVGFDCPENPLVNKNALSPNKRKPSSMSMELELVATKFTHLRDTSLYSKTDIRTIVLAEAKHPMNSEASVTLFHDRQDRTKIISDYHSRVKYIMKIGNILEAHTCHIQKIPPQEEDLAPDHDPSSVSFDNGIVLSLDPQMIEFLFGHIDGLASELRLLNQINVSPTKDEFVYESKVPLKYQRLVKMTHGDLIYVATDMNIIRVFEQSIKVLPYTSSVRRGALKLTRIMVVVYDKKRTEKIAEIRFNILDDLQWLTLARRARLFDVSACYDLKEESMEVVAKYPIEPVLADYASKRGHEFVEQFYFSALDWNSAEGEPNGTNTDFSTKKRLGSTLNFLRLPKIHLKITEDGDLELRTLILDKLSPLYAFERLAEADISDGAVDERFMAQSEQICSKYCEELNCRMFSYHKTRFECKLSHTNFAPDIDDDRGNLVERKEHCQVYYSILPGGTESVEEASLVELATYLEHSLDDLGSIAGQTDEDEYDEALSRPKRSNLPVESRPLFGFQIIDRTSGDFSAVEKTLVPSDIHIPHTPRVLDVSAESEIHKVARAFRPGLDGKKYVINSLEDLESSSPELWKTNERIFINDQQSVFFTLKKIESSSIDICSLLCYNIEQYDSDLKSEQTCTSFSFCHFEKECVLVTKTDFNFTSADFETVTGKDKLRKMDSLDQFVKGGYGCVISERNSLVGFEGPIRLAPGYFAEKTTDHIDEISDLDIEWLRVFSSQSSELESNIEDRCASECSKRNKLGKLCLAIDVCSRRSTEPNDATKTRYEASCYLLLIEKIERRSQKVDFIQKIGLLRDELSQARPKESRAGDDDSARCKRYLLTHLHDYNHLRQVQISNTIGKYITQPASMLADSNLDRCALDCYLQRDKCLLYEYCSGLDKETGEVMRNCTLFGRPRSRFRSSLLLQGNGGDKLTNYNRNCHVYLKRPLSNLHEYIDSVTSSDTDGFQHYALVVWFSTVYGIALTIVIAVFVMRWKGISILEAMSSHLSLSK